jgi:hypothetical protein
MSATITLPNGSKFDNENIAMLVQFVAEIVTELEEKTIAEAKNLKPEDDNKIICGCTVEFNLPKCFTPYGAEKAAEAAIRLLALGVSDNYGAIKEKDIPMFVMNKKTTEVSEKKGRRTVKRDIVHTHDYEIKINLQADEDFVKHIRHCPGNHSEVEVEEAPQGDNSDPTV